MKNYMLILNKGSERLRRDYDIIILYYQKIIESSLNKCTDSI